METSNKIIAEFMGYIKHTQTKAYLTTDGYFHERDLKFHKDWNWLMEVVEKIESLGYSVNISSSMVYINGDNSRIVSSFNIGFKITKIEAVYNACVEFIKWYNENPAKEK